VEILRDFLSRWHKWKSADDPASEPIGSEPPPLSASPASDEIQHHVFASSFADPADVRAFRKWRYIYIGEGKSPAEAEKLAFAKGDNGIGCFGDDCTGPVPMCALPPEDMEERWGSIDAARHRPVEVSCNGRSVVCTLGDRMPHRANIKNGAGIDLNPPACDALKLKPPVMVRAAWRWG
jgi:hypothetical protein